jgi:hypothetical protein
MMDGEADSGGHPADRRAPRLLRSGACLAFDRSNEQQAVLRRHFQSRQDVPLPTGIPLLQQPIIRKDFDLRKGEVQRTREQGGVRKGRGPVGQAGPASSVPQHPPGMQCVMPGMQLHPPNGHGGAVSQQAVLLRPLSPVHPGPCTLFHVRQAESTTTASRTGPGDAGILRVTVLSRLVSPGFSGGNFSCASPATPQASVVLPV